MTAKIWVFAAAIASTALAADLGSTSPLVDAVKAGNRTAALALISQKANVNAPESDGTTALHWAAHNNDPDLVDRLLKAGADAKVQNEFGATPMSEAAFNANTEIIDKLLKAGADPDSPSVDGQTALMLIARSNN